MPQHVSCPHCMAVLKPSKIPPVGTRVRCPKCGESFVLDASAIFDSQPTNVPARPAPIANPVKPAIASARVSQSLSAAAAAAVGTPPWIWGIAGAVAATALVLGALWGFGFFTPDPPAPTIHQAEPAMAKASAADAQHNDPPPALAAKPEVAVVKPPDQSRAEPQVLLVDSVVAEKGSSRLQDQPVESLPRPIETSTKPEPVAVNAVPSTMSPALTVAPVADSRQGRFQFAGAANRTSYRRSTRQSLRVTVGPRLWLQARYAL